jgi:Raf kinase inhibitor-like YbhB/YbcL family protein
MKKTFFITFGIIILAVLGVLFWLKTRPVQTQTPPPINAQNNMRLLSSAFLNNQFIPEKYTCDGLGVNPPLDIQGVPPEAKSLVLIVDDPDAPAGTWVHWLVWNIDPTTTGIDENSVPPKALSGQASSGQNVYGAPCPPFGQHRYFFKLYALDLKLSIPTYSVKEDLEKAMAGHVIGQTELVGIYAKK